MTINIKSGGNATDDDAVTGEEAVLQGVGAQDQATACLLCSGIVRQRIDLQNDGRSSRRARRYTEGREVVLGSASGLRQATRRGLELESRLRPARGLGSASGFESAEVLTSARGLRSARVPGPASGSSFRYGLDLFRCD